MRLPLLFLIAALAGCATPGSESVSAGPVDAGRLAASTTLADVPATADWPNEAWWCRFADPQLDALIAEALAQSPTLAAAAARARRADALAAAAAAERRPNVGLNAQATDQHYSKRSLIPPPIAGSTRTFGQLSADFAEELDFWGRQQASLDAAGARARAAAVEAAAARLLLSAAIARSYVDFDLALAEQDLAAEEYARRQAQVELIALRVGAQLAGDVELRAAEAAAASAQAELAAAGERIVLLRQQLAALAGQGPDRGLALVRPQLASAERLALPARLPADLLGRRPDVIARRLRVDAAAADTDAARAAFYPNVNLLAFVGVQSLGLGQLFAAGSGIAGVGPAVHLPLFDGGRLQAGLAGRRADYALAVADYDATLVEALHELADGVAGWRGALARQAAQQAALTAAQAALRATETRVGAGLAGRLDALAAQAPVLDARRRLAASRAQLLTAAIDVDRALGGGAAVRRD